MRIILSFSLALSFACTACSARNAMAQTTGDADLPEAPGSILSTTVVLPDTYGGNDQPGVKAVPDADVSIKKFPINFLRDEAGIFTSPARLKKADLKWLLPLAGATAASLSTDSYTMRNVVSRDADFNNANATASDALRGAAIGVPVLLFAAGHLKDNEEMRRTGLLAGEAMVDAYAFDAVIKFATLRERPKIDNARGHFFTGDAASDPSFISGHSIVAWSSVAVLAGEYNRPWQQAGIYALASGVSLTRVLSQNHFPTDALLGSAAGWLIGRYVFRTHSRHVAK